MFRLLPSMKRVLRDRRGVSAMEYVLMIVGIAAAVAGGAAFLGGQVGAALSNAGWYINQHQFN